MAWNQNPYQGGRRQQGNYGAGNKQTYPNSGGLWARDKNNPQAADMGGTISIDDDVLAYVVRCYEQGAPVSLEISAWRKQSRQGNNYMSLKVQTPWSERQGQQQFRPQNRFPPRQNFNSQQEDRRGNYGQQSGRDDGYRNDPPTRAYTERMRVDDRPKRQGMSDEEFSRGDELPDFMRDDEPPFDR